MKSTYILLLALLLLGCGEDNSNPPSSTNAVVTHNSVEQNAEAAVLYESCQPCHGQNGEKEALGHSRGIANFSKQDIIDAIDGYRNDTRDLYGFGPLMKGQAIKLTTNETKILADYIARF